MFDLHLPASVQQILDAPDKRGIHICPNTDISHQLINANTININLKLSNSYILGQA